MTTNNVSANNRMNSPTRNNLMIKKNTPLPFPLVLILGRDSILSKNFCRGSREVDKSRNQRPFPQKKTKGNKKRGGRKRERKREGPKNLLNLTRKN